MEEIKRIAVLGSGCKSCHALYENAAEAVRRLGLNVEVEYITELRQLAEYGIMSTPALAVNGRQVSAGRVLKTEEIERLLR